MSSYRPNQVFVVQGIRMACSNKPIEIGDWVMDTRDETFGTCVNIIGNDIYFGCACGHCDVETLKVPKECCIKVVRFNPQFN